MPDRVFDYEEDLKIDPTALDVEWLEQPNLYFRYGDALSKARKKYEDAERDLTVLEAEEDARIRKEAKEDDEKITEAAIRQKIILNKRCKVMRDTIAVLHEEVELLQVAVRAMDHKKEALENLVRLMGQQYFAAPREPRDLKMEYDKTTKQDSARDKIVSRTRRTK